MMFTKKIGTVAFIFLVLLLSINRTAEGIDLNRLSQEDSRRVDEILKKLKPLISQREKKFDLAILTTAELYAPLDSDDLEFLKSIENLDANELNIKIPHRGEAAGNVTLVLIKGQKVKSKEGFQTLAPKFLPEEVYQSYTSMMNAMQNDIGKRLYIESGYRSNAYQLYVFIRSLKSHGYSIRETTRFVALPGYSEHGDPEHQAIDFISEDGIGCQSNVKDYEELAEYKWLLLNAGKFGFVLSYPRDSKDGITFEPWHWRYEKNASQQEPAKK